MHLKLERMQELLRHRVPNGDYAVIIDLALDLLLAKTLKERFGIKASSNKAARASKSTTPSASHAARTSDPAPVTSETELSVEQVEPKPAPKRSRYIPRAVRREVYARDQGQCSFVSAEGKRCKERGFAELHHHHAFALGGEATIKNIQLTCRAHNQFLAEKDFGRAHIHSKRSQRASRANEMPPHM